MSELSQPECVRIPWRRPWRGDDFDPCFRVLVIDQAVPFAVAAASAAILLATVSRWYFCRSAESIWRRAGRPGQPSLLNDISRQSWFRGYGAIVSDAANRTDTDDPSGYSSASERRSSSGSSSNLSPSSPSESPPPQTRPPLSIRDMVLVVSSTTQLILAGMVYTGHARGEVSGYETGLWLWALALCMYLFCRRSSHAPSPSPHLRLVYLAGFAIDAIKARTALLAYSRDEIGLPVVPLLMAGLATVLFLFSFTQQRRRHGLPRNAPPGASGTYPPAPELTASIAQLLFFSWVDPMIMLGYRRSLEPKDVYDLTPDDHSERICARWRAECRQYVRRHGRDHRSLTRRLFWFFRYRLAVQCIWTLAHTVAIFASPFLLRHILAYMEDPTIYTREHAFWYVAGLLAGGTLGTVCQSQALWIGRKIGLQIKAIVIGEVYAKSLRRRDAATGDTKDGMVQEGAEVDASSGPGESGGSSMGKITNLMAVDAHKVSEVSAYLHLLYQLPAEIVITVLMLYQLLGVASLGGVGAIVFLVPIQWRLVSIWGVYQSQLMKASDRRMGLMNEILQGVRIIKFFAWEPQFEQQVAGIRGGELGVLRKRYLVFSYSIVLFFMAPVFVTLTTFTVYTKVMGMQLTASVAFTALALFKTLRGPMDQLPDFFSYCLQAKVSVGRVSKFLAEEETPKYALSRLSQQPHDAYIDDSEDLTYADVVSATKIGFANASFSWSSSATGAGDGQRASVASGVLPAEPTTGTETEPLLSGLTAASANVENTQISHSGATATPRPISDGFELRDLTVNFPVGKLSIIAGPCASGKTSMLMALLGEMRLIGGRVMIPGAAFDAQTAFGENSQDVFALHNSVAYVAQQAWLLNDTIRGNITFGLPYNEARYREVVHMCALSRDLETFDAGDMTEVGERGVSLSGGQKQRICLARAVYSPARHILMDDCLSAVDAHTAKHLYEACLMSPYMLDRTRILVTHAVGLTIRGAAMVVVMQDGQIAASGTPAEVLQSGKLSEETLRESTDDDQDHKRPNKALEAVAADETRAASNGSPETTISTRFDDMEPGKNSDSPSSSEQAQGTSNDNTQRGRLTTDEAWSRGHVQWRVYIKYIRASGGVLMWSVLALLFLVGQGLQVAQDWWLREWAASYSRPAMVGNVQTELGHAVALLPAAPADAASPLSRSLQVFGDSDPGSWRTHVATAGGRVDLAYFIGVYVAIALACVVIILGRSLVQFWCSLKASKALHEQLLHTVLRAPVRFFDTTPVGRLINRFSKDMETIDQNLSSSLAIFVTELTASLAILVVISVITPTFTLGAIAIAAIYWVIGTLYLSTSREIKRFESVTKSPIYTQFGETLNGVSTIRAYGQETRFKKTNYAKVDDNLRPFIAMWSCNRWLSIRVDLAGALVSFMAGLLALAATGRMDAGLAGLSLSYALNFTEHILWVVRFYSVNEMNLNSVERVVEYLDVPPEAPVSMPANAPPANWPSNGQISVENLVLRYADNLPAVIRGMSFEVKPREKVGIVGRTGSGKTTLTLAMLRIMEASGGRIIVDGVDISQIGVGDLRSRLTIIPQDPVLFTGSIRTNLDPFNKHGDDELWLALRRAHLLGSSDDGALQSSASTISDAASHDASSAKAAGSKPAGTAVSGRAISGLGMAVMENGSNFSQGQRQLIALARALVKHTQVIILDEATASVDFDTDAKIQATIRTEFAESTLLCIAHRLRTIADYDRVLVLDQGTVAEYDTPYNLLNKSDGLFRQMCVRSGEYDHLFSAAERKHHRAERE
ncbi:Transporter of the ATP-binding cassette (ABC) [Coemansia sp. RSA 552]|nr:Transporter of the ATP-binding cassette (ABC) [Coemansia sp. RSA 552]